MTYDSLNPWEPIKFILNQMLSDLSQENEFHDTFHINCYTNSASIKPEYVLFMASCH